MAVDKTFPNFVFNRHPTSMTNLCLYKNYPRNYKISARNSLFSLFNFVLQCTSLTHFIYCHSPTQPQLELVLDLIMGRKPPTSFIISIL